jgi:dTDP-4-amino-4,6-dideoxygalactose transaminase
MTSIENIQMVDLHSQYLAIKDEVDAAMQEVIDSCAFINGPAVKSFAADLEAYLNVKHVIPCANGTDALQIALMALDLQPGDEVITTPFTFIATAEVISLLKLKPVFVDVDPKTFTIDPNLIEDKITDRTKVIIPVHLYGQACDMDAIMDVANKHNLAVVEDTAQAIGGHFKGKDATVMTGTTGTIGCTSFFPSKNLGCFGDGGAIFTNDDAIAQKIRVICNHGSEKKYFHTEVGVNSRLDSIQAAVLKIKLAKLDEYCDARRKVSAGYKAGFESNDALTVPFEPDYSHHVYHQYTLIMEEGNRDELQVFLKERGVPSMIYYPVPLHIQEAYASYGYKNGDFPISEELAKKVISLPIHTEMKDDVLDYIVSSVNEFFKK